MRALLAGLAAMLLLAAGCSDSDGDAAPSAATSDDSVSTSSEATVATTAPAATVASTTTPTTASATTGGAAPQPLGFSVEGVVGGSAVPIEFTCDGENRVPLVTIEGVPANVVELALIVDDPDAPTASPFVHWAVYGISAQTSSVDDGDTSLTYGRNDAGIDGWFGPCPPPADGLHTYRWKLFGLSSALGLEPGLDGRAVQEAIADVTVAEALLISSYARAD